MESEPDLGDGSRDGERREHGITDQRGRRYILGTQRGQLKRHEEELLSGDWQEIQAGLEVKRVDSPDGKEVFILCRSRERAQKEKAIHDRFEQRIEGH